MKIRFHRNSNTHMEVNCSHISYHKTGFFSKIVTDYLAQAPELQPFYEHEVSIKGIEQSIEARKKFNTNRTILVDQLNQQYAGLPLNELQQQNIQSLLNENTFTVTTAHQPNIFTGPLYFIYKIMHAIKLADVLKQQLPQYNFVPFYYMGSEDADLEELGYINLGGEKLVWETNQTGAVGRMKVDKKFLELIHRIYGQIGVFEHGKALVELFKQTYAEGKTIQQATLELLNILFQQFGLLILIPDNAILKAEFNKIISKEIETKYSNNIVQNTINQLSKNYKVQTAGRPINLFYLYENHRERIEQEGDLFVIKKINKQFELIELQQEIKNYPDRFSPNVILRGVFQETILPNIAFIGGGGELAYWLELKEVFKASNAPYPVLVLRNSFLFIEEKFSTKIQNTSLKLEDLFKPEFDLIKQKVEENSHNQLSLEDELDQIKRVYLQIEHLSGLVDATLTDHVKALKKQAISKLEQLEKKIQRAEKRKFAELNTEIQKIKRSLFPNNSLQERVENFSIYYAKYGKDWLQHIYNSSFSLEQEFTIIH